MKMFTRAVCAAVLVAVAGFSANAQGPLGDDFTYQGQLLNAGLPASGSFDMQFRLFDSPAAGLQIGGTLASTVTVDSAGRFSVALDFAGLTSFNGNERFLSISVSPAGAGVFTTLNPRQELRPSPHASYSLAAGNATTAVNATNATTAANALALNSQNAAFYQNAANMSSGTLPGARLSGAYANPLTFGSAANVFFGNGANLTGLNAANIASGTILDARLSSNVALRNAANPFTGLNTFAADTVFNGDAGFGTATPSVPVDVVTTGATAIRTNGSGAWLLGSIGVNTTIENATGPATAFNAIVNGTGTRYGLRADINGATGTAYGVNVQNASASGRGYYANMTSTTGTNYGVYVANSSATGFGGYFNNTALTGTTYGIYAENNSPDGYGIYARHDAPTGTGPAVYGTTDSTSTSAYSVHGVVASTAPGVGSAAIRGQNNGTASSGYGVFGSHAGTGYGVYGTAATGGRGVYGDSGGEGYGVYGATDDGTGVYGVASPTNTSEICYGVRGVGGNSDSAYGGYFTVSGSGYGVYGYSTGSYGGYFDTGVSGGAALYVNGTASVGVITIRGGADLAEDFEVVNQPDTIEPGMLVMIDPDHVGGVMLASGAYNKCVAGVISGANDLKAGMVLGQFEGQVNGKPVALSGRVWTYVDASAVAVEPGDLLTTADLPGYAMPVVDHSRAHGATIGKAMSRLEKGEKGLVLVLVNLQ